MDRYIFKAKRVDNEEWVHGYYANCRYKDKLQTGHFIIQYPNSQHEIYTSTLCQCTGFKDESGKDIFEGDKLILTVEYEDYDGEEKVECVTGVVEWYEGGWIVDSEQYDEDTLYEWANGVVTVIGNIHDKPISKNCKTCEYYYEEHCSNGNSDYCTEPVSKDDSCKDWVEGDKHGSRGSH